MKKVPNLQDLYNLIKEETESKYTIFCDLDGVLVDFDKGYKDLTGVTTKHADSQGKEVFWDTFRQGLEDKDISEYEYWKDLSWMPDGKELWSFIKSYDPYILSAPTRDPESKTGKKAWVSDNLGKVKGLILVYAYKKPEYSGKNRILIDDRAQTIKEWRSKGGIGILHTSTSDTIEKLKKLGL